MPRNIVKDRKPQTGQQLLLRFPEGSDMRDRLNEIAKGNGRSLSAEIVHRLEWTLDEANGYGGAAPAVEERIASLAEDLSHTKSEILGDFQDSLNTALRRLDAIEAAMRKLDPTFEKDEG